MKTHTHAYIQTCTHSYTNKNTYLNNIKHIWSTACCRRVSSFYVLEIGGSIMSNTIRSFGCTCRTVWMNCRLYCWLSNANFFLTVRPKLCLVFHIMLTPISKTQNGLTLLQHAVRHMGPWNCELVKLMTHMIPWYCDLVKLRTHMSPGTVSWSNSGHMKNKSTLSCSNSWHIEDLGAVSKSNSESKDKNCQEFDQWWPLIMWADQIQDTFGPFVLWAGQTQDTWITWELWAG